MEVLTLGPSPRFLYPTQICIHKTESGNEFMALWYKVTPETKDDFTNYTAKNYKQIVQEEHMVYNGNLDRLKQDEPDAFKPYVSQKFKDGTYQPDIDRDAYWVNNGHFSPPPISYTIVNWNHGHVPPVAAAVDATYALQYETVFTIVMAYRSIHLVLTAEEHAAYHSKLKDSTPEHPHVLANHPIHRDPTDENSEIVAMISSGVALDASLLDLLPEDVNGLHCVLKNNANQTFTYEINGHDAIYLAPEDLHEAQYDHLEVEVDLSIQTHPLAKGMPGNTQFRMVSAQEPASEHGTQ